MWFEGICRFRTPKALKRGREWNRCRAGIKPASPFMSQSASPLWANDLKRDVLNIKTNRACQQKNCSKNNYYTENALNALFQSK
jgi:hypothetical protein